jgi:hypothetical protein
VLLLGGGAAALAATGVLSGAPVKPEGPLQANAGAGVPVSGGPGHLALIASDPAGGLPWGLRIVRTTREETCAQVGRVHDGRLGVLGLDSAFANDGRFHELAQTILPPGYGAGSGQVECIPAGRTFIVEQADADRSGLRLLPEEFAEPPTAHRRQLPPAGNLRALAYGLLGPHAISVTYSTPAGTRTVPVSGADGAFLIVEPAAHVKTRDLVGGTIEGGALAGSLPVTPRFRSGSIVSAVTVRLGKLSCSQGTGAPVRTPCPVSPAAPARTAYTPTRSLNAPVKLTLLPQPHAACRAAFLNDPCYRGQVKFTAPYAITRAGTDYVVQGRAQCKVGGRPETGWALERNVRLHETVRTDSLGLFVFTPACASTESFQVEYLNPQGPSRSAHHESVIVGTVALGEATLPDGTPIGRR